MTFVVKLNGGKDVKAMKVDSVAPINAKKQQLINAKNTGYVAVAGMGLSVASGLVNNKFLRKNHKIFAGLSFAAVIAHIYLVGGKNKQKKTSPTK